MKTTIYKTIFLIALFIQVAANSQAQTPEQQFQKGIMKEEGEGSLREAIELYKSVADNAEADKVLRAKALYQMGNCYEKLGQQEARNVYEKLVANYTDPQELVANAKRKLSKMNVDYSAGSNGIVARQIWSRAIDGANPCVPSPNGRYVVYNDYVSVQLAVRDLKTGENREITKNGTWVGKTQYPEQSIWSSDSKQILYTWYVNSGDWIVELHSVNIDGTNDLKIKSSIDFAPTDWSKDGNSVLGIKYPEKDSCNLVLFSVKDGSEKIVAKMGNLKIQDASFSGDDNFIIFNVESEPKSGNFDIYSVSKGGGMINPLITNKENDENPKCVPGTNQVVFLSNHSGTRDLWSMVVVDGKLIGEPKIIKSGFDKTCRLTGITDNGNLFYSSATLNPDIYIARLDFVNGEVSSKPVKLLVNHSGKAIKSFWSPLLTYIATIVEAPVDSIRGANQVKIVIQNRTSGNEYEINTDLYSYPTYDWIEPKWTKDEQSILVKAYYKNKEGGGWYKIDAKTGKYKAFKVPLLSPAWEWSGLQFSPDGETMYFTDATVRNNGDTVNLIARSVNSGEDKIIKKLERVKDMLLSPDGKSIAFSLAFADNNSLFVIPVEGSSEFKKIASSYEKVTVYPIGWTSDSKNVLFAKVNGSKEVAIWSASLDNIPPKQLFSSDKLKAFTGARNLKIYQTGNDTYLTMQMGSSVYDLWTIENIAQK